MLEASSLCKALPQGKKPLPGLDSCELTTTQFYKRVTHCKAMSFRTIWESTVLGLPHSLPRCSLYYRRTHERAPITTVRHNWTPTRRITKLCCNSMNRFSLEVFYITVDFHNHLCRRQFTAVNLFYNLALFLLVITCWKKIEYHWGRWS